MTDFPHSEDGKTRLASVWTPETNTIATMFLTPEQLAALKDAEKERGGIVYASSGHELNAANFLTNIGLVYRAKPAAAEVPDSIDWNAVHERYTSMERLPGELGVLYPGGLRADAFASYRRGNMASCTVWRPGFEPKEGE